METKMRWHYYCGTFSAKNVVRHGSFTKPEKFIAELQYLSYILFLDLLHNMNL